MKQKNFGTFKFGKTFNNTSSLNIILNEGTFELLHSIRKLIADKQATARKISYWHKITKVTLVDNWICVLTDKNMSDIEKIQAIKVFKNNKLLYKDKTYQWAAKGYRDLLKSSYLALGPWSSRGKIWSPNGLKARGMVRISR
jgi:hypothetical protein